MNTVEEHETCTYYLTVTTNYMLWDTTVTLERHMGPSQYKDRLSQVMGIPMLKIRRSRDRLIFNMVIPILVRRHLYIETCPRSISPKEHKLFQLVGMVFTNHVYFKCVSARKTDSSALAMELDVSCTNPLISYLMRTDICNHKADTLSRADCRFAPSQWEIALLCNDASHWLGASLESA